MAATNKDKHRKAVIDALNKARSSELHAIHQYMNQHYNLDDMNYPKLASKMREIAIDEMRHAEDFAERIKDLDGEPTAEFSAKFTVLTPTWKTPPLICITASGSCAVKIMTWSAPGFLSVSLMRSRSTSIILTIPTTTSRNWATASWPARPTERRIRGQATLGGS